MCPRDPDRIDQLGNIPFYLPNSDLCLCHVLLASRHNSCIILTKNIMQFQEEVNRPLSFRDQCPWLKTTGYEVTPRKRD